MFLALSCSWLYLIYCSQVLIENEDVVGASPYEWSKVFCLTKVRFNIRGFTVYLVSEQNIVIFPEQKYNRPFVC